VASFNFFLRLLYEKRGRVPALRLPTEHNAVIYESAICNEFLCDYATKLQKHHTLMPADPITRAKIRLLNDHCDVVFSKTQFTYLMNKNDDINESLRAEMEDALKCYEDALVEGKGPYLMGSFFTLADLHVFPFIQRLVITLKHWKDYELPSDKFPNLLAWHDSCMTRESVKESSMTTEKTIEVYGRFVDADYKFGGLNKSK
jgi:glutathione S-transferase